MGLHRTVAAPCLQATGRRHRERPLGGAGDLGEQPPVLRGLVVHAADAVEAGHLRGEGGVLQRSRHQGLAPEVVLLGLRTGADRPVERQRGRGGTAVGEAGPERRRDLRDLPRGDPLARREAVPRQDRGRPPRTRDRGPRDPGRGGRHRRRGASGQEVRLVHPPAGPLRQAAGLLALRGPRERPLHPAVDHRRDHVRDHAALRPGVRRHLRQQGEGPRQGGRAQGCSGGEAKRADDSGDSELKAS